MVVLVGLLEVRDADEVVPAGLEAQLLLDAAGDGFAVVLGDPLGVRGVISDDVMEDRTLDLRSEAACKRELPRQVPR